MPQTSHPAERYSLIEDHGSNDKFDVEDLPFEYSNRPTRRRLSTCWKSCAALFCLVAAFAAGTQISGAAFWQSGVSLEKHQAPSSCKDPPTRREWRSLSKIEKSNYIAAVQCLRDSHSKIGVEQTMYDDFPWVHSRFGEYCGCFSLSYLIFELMDGLSAWNCRLPLMASILPSHLRKNSSGAVQLQRTSSVRTLLIVCSFTMLTILGTGTGASTGRT